MEYIHSEECSAQQIETANKLYSPKASAKSEWLWFWMPLQCRQLTISNVLSLPQVMYLAKDSHRSFM